MLKRFSTCWKQHRCESQRERGREKTGVFSLPFFYISEEDKDIIEDGGMLYGKKEVFVF